LPVEIIEALERLGGAKGKRGRPRVVVDFDLYGENEKGEPRGLVLSAPFGIKVDEIPKEADGEDGCPNSTEDDTAGLIFDFPLALEGHTCDVEVKTEDFVERVGLPEAHVSDLKLAASLHDLGKGDSRFQAWMHFGDPLGFDPDSAKDILAKSGRILPRSARKKAGLPDWWRHEALSVRLARTDARFARATDPDLVLWLIGSHHGHGRPFFPHHDPTEEAPNVGPQSLAFDWNGLDWPSLFAQLKTRYGMWELARMEAILRLADHRASEEARDRAVKEEGE
jgi:CRISPR-associated endonuclease/helicase Cas3